MKDKPLNLKMPMHPYPMIDDLIKLIVAGSNHPAGNDAETRYKETILALFGDHNPIIDGRSKKHYDYDQACFTIARYVDEGQAPNFWQAVLLYFGEAGLGQIMKKSNITRENAIRRYIDKINDAPEKYRDPKQIVVSAFKGVRPVPFETEVEILKPWLDVWTSVERMIEQLDS